MYLEKIYKMNTTELKGNWKELKGKLKKSYAELTDNDLLYEEGREDELFGRLQQKLGKSKDEVKRMITEMSGH